LIERLHRDHERGYPVVNLDSDLVGIVTMRGAEEALMGRNTAELRVRDICTRNVVVCRPDQTLSAAISQFGVHSFGRLPVIDPDRPSRMVGILRRTDIVSAYLDAWRRGSEMTERDEALRSARVGHDMVLAQGTVGAGAALSGKTVREAVFPEKATLGVIRRGPMSVVPRGSTVIQPGDTLVLLTTRGDAPEVREWLGKMT